MPCYGLAEVTVFASGGGRAAPAVAHLDAGKSISEVALLVGFAQASTFHRAFRSWTGETPADYQVQRRNGARKPEQEIAPVTRH